MDLVTPPDLRLQPLVLRETLAVLKQPQLGWLALLIQPLRGTLPELLQARSPAKPKPRLKAEDREPCLPVLPEN
jgi:hypothetical protein